jgi:hypothetical protein
MRKKKFFFKSAVEINKINGNWKTNLEEANVVGVLLEASAANVHAVLSDDTVVVGAHAADLKKKKIF